MTAPEVSVVIPTRNRWGLLSRSALRSALAQEAVEHEVIVVDDGSTDETPARLAELDEPRTRVVLLGENRGVARARNAGIAAARGRWIAFLDDDDLWSPLKLRTQVDAANAAGADTVFARVVAVDVHGAVQYVFPLPDPAELPRRLLAASALPAGCSNVVARTELVRSLGGFDEQLHQLADWDLWIRLAWAGSVAACEETLVAYVEHPDNMLLTDERDVTRELVYLERKHRAMREEQGVDLDRVTFAHWVAWGHLRSRRRLSAARVFLGSGIANHRLKDVGLAAGFALRAALPVNGALRRFSPHASARPPLSRGILEPRWLELYR